MVAFRIAGEPPRLHILEKVLQGLYCGISEMRVLPDEFRQTVIVHAQHVMENQHLPIAIFARADADSGDWNAPRDLLCENVRDTFQYYRKDASRRQSPLSASARANI